MKKIVELKESIFDAYFKKKEEKKKLKGHNKPKGILIHKSGNKYHTR